MMNNTGGDLHEVRRPSPRVWQDAPDLDENERQVAEALKAAAEAMLAIPESEQIPFANPDKFFGPIGFLESGLPSGGVAAHAPRPRRSWLFTVVEMAVLLRAIGAAPSDDRAGSALPAQDMAVAHRDLVGRGVLTEHGPDPDLAMVMLTAVQPDAAIIATIVRQDQPVRQVMLNQREGQAVINWVDIDGCYHFDLYPADQASTGLWRYVAYDLNVLLPLPPSRSAQSVQQAMSAAIYTVTLVGKNLQENRAMTFGWFIGDNTLWMLRVAPFQHPDAQPAPAPQTEPVDYMTLEAAMVSFCRQVIEESGV